MIGKGPIERSPLKAQVVVTMPKKRPAMVCHRFQPRYGMLVGIPKRQAEKPPEPKDDLDKLMDALDELEI